jgi:hypothetical protein
MSETDLQREINDLRARLDYLQAPDPNPTLSELPATFLALPALRGLWMAGDANEGGGMPDLTGQARTLTYNGAPQIALYNSLVSYYALLGGGDFFSRASEAGLNVAGTETYVISTQRGLTIGGWFWINATATRYGLMSKYLSAGNQRSYSLWVFETGTVPQFYVSSNGTATTTVSSGVALAAGAWYFIVGRYVPSTSVDVYVNNAKTTNVVSVPASIFASTSALEIGRFDGGSALAGRWPLAFLCAAALPDTLLSYVFQRTRGIFGV